MSVNDTVTYTDSTGGLGIRIRRVRGMPEGSFHGHRHTGYPVEPFINADIVHAPGYTMAILKAVDQAVCGVLYDNLRFNITPTSLKQFTEKLDEIRRLYETSSQVQQSHSVKLHGNQYLFSDRRGALYLNVTEEDGELEVTSHVNIGISNFACLDHAALHDEMLQLVLNRTGESIHFTEPKYSRFDDLSVEREITVGLNRLVNEHGILFPTDWDDGTVPVSIEAL